MQNLAARMSRPQCHHKVCANFYTNPHFPRECCDFPQSQAQPLCTKLPYSMISGTRVCKKLATAMKAVSSQSLD
eukprot:1767567-Amphidinium_carterae.1